MAGLLNWIVQDTLKRKERDGIASETMEEGNIRRWKRLTSRLVLFSQVSSKFFIQGKGSHIAMFLFLSGVIRLLLRLF
jgi:hypothetical protein